MSTFTTAVHWERGAQGFSKAAYRREHSLHFAGGQTLTNSAAADYGGDAAASNPEELLLGALSSCHMLTFLALCANRGWDVSGYQDHADCTLAKNADGKMAITEATLHPKVSFDGKTPTAEEFDQLHQRAHANCFIGLSVKTTIHVDASIIRT